VLSLAFAVLVTNRRNSDYIVPNRFRAVKLCPYRTKGRKVLQMLLYS